MPHPRTSPALSCVMSVIFQEESGVVVFKTPSGAESMYGDPELGVPN